MTAIMDIEKLVVILLNLDQPDENRYGYKEELKSCTKAELVDRINKEVGIPHWGGSRADYLAHLYVEFLSRDLDCSNFFSSLIVNNVMYNTMCIAKRLRLEGNKVVIAT